MYFSSKALWNWGGLWSFTWREHPQRGDLGKMVAEIQPPSPQSAKLKRRLWACESAGGGGITPPLMLPKWRVSSLKLLLFIDQWRPHLVQAVGFRKWLYLSRRVCKPESPLTNFDREFSLVALLQIRWWSQGPAKVVEMVGGITGCKLPLHRNSKMNAFIQTVECSLNQQPYQWSRWPKDNLSVCLVHSWTHSMYVTTIGSPTLTFYFHIYRVQSLRYCCPH